LSKVAEYKLLVAMGGWQLLAQRIFQPQPRLSDTSNPAEWFMLRFSF
jgi:hypothetical protein